MATCQLGFLMDLTWLLHGGRPVRPRPRLRCEGCVADAECREIDLTYWDRIELTGFPTSRESAIGS